MNNLISKSLFARIQATKLQMTQPSRHRTRGRERYLSVTEALPLGNGGSQSPQYWIFTSGQKIKILFLWNLNIPEPLINPQAPVWQAFGVSTTPVTGPSPWCKAPPLGTQRCYDVESTSLTLIQHRNNVACPVGPKVCLVHVFRV